MEEYHQKAETNVNLNSMFSENILQNEGKESKHFYTNRT